MNYYIPSSANLQNRPKPISSFMQTNSMPKIIEAIYENGVFKPLQKVDLREGERVKISVSSVVRKTKGLLRNSEMEKIIEEIESESVF